MLRLGSIELCVGPKFELEVGKFFWALARPNPEKHFQIGPRPNGNLAQPNLISTLNVVRFGNFGGYAFL